MKRLIIKCLSILGMMLVLNPAMAHNRSESFSTWSFLSDGRVNVQFSVLTREVTRLVNSERPALDWLNKMYLAHLNESISLFTSDNQCQRDGDITLLSSRSGYSRAELNWTCPKTDIFTLSVGSFQKYAANHMHYAMIRKGSGQKQEYVFSSSVGQHSINFENIEQPISKKSSLEDFVIHLWIGIEHIILGLDHLLFVMGMLLLAYQYQSNSKSLLIYLITGFTIGHSISMISAIVGWVTPDIPLVEAFIGFSILLLAVEVLSVKEQESPLIRIFPLIPLFVALFLGGIHQDWLSALALLFLSIFTYFYLSGGQDKSYSLRLLLTAFFGLIHGFGFASSFLSMGFNEHNLVGKLVGFNLGVEVGQLLIIALVVSFVWLSRSINYTFEWLRSLTLITISSFGMFWFFERTVI